MELKKETRTTMVVRDLYIRQLIMDDITKKDTFLKEKENRGQMTR